MSSLLIGITGGIGTGKTTVCKIINSFGIPVYNADQEAKRIMTTKDDVIEEIVKLFGDNSYLENGDLNRKLISQTAFSNSKILQKLNNIVHPAVKDDFILWTQSHQQHKYLVKEAALLIENKSYLELDKTFLVKSPLELRISRLLKRDPHRNREEIQQIINKQMPENEKIKLVDGIISNDEHQFLVPQVLSIFELL